MTVALDSREIARGFSAAAESYDRWAGPQRRCGAHLAALLPQDRRPERVLDVGCGTGTLALLLWRRFPGAGVLGIDLAGGMIDFCRRRWAGRPRLTFLQADAERFDTPQPFDLIGSNFCFQWFPRPGETIARLAGMLASGGLLAAAVPVEGSLPEMDWAWRRHLGGAMPGPGFAPARAYLDGLGGCGLRTVRQEVLSARTFFAGGLEVLRYFRATGTSQARPGGQQRLSAGQTRGIVETYQQRFARSDGQVPLTWATLYFVAEAG